MLSEKPLLKDLWLLFIGVGIFIYPLKHFLNVSLGLQYPIDFAIYHKAIIEIGSFHSFNPYLALRDIQIFADHFDPFLIIPAVFSGFFNYSPLYSLLIEAFFVFLLFILILREFKKESLLDFSLLMSLAFFNRSLFSGLNYPIHPTLWSLPFLYLTIKEVTGTGLVFSTFINFFKEVFCLFLLPAAITGYLLEKEKRWLKLIGIQAVFIGIIFVIRPAIWKTYSYAVDPIEGFKAFNFIDLLKMTAPSLLLLLIVRKTLNLKKLIIFLSFYFPSVLLHIISGKSYYHYGVFLAYPLIFYVLCEFKNWKEYLNPKLKLVIILLSIIISFNGLMKGFKSLYSNYQAYNNYKEHGQVLKKLKIEITRLLPGSKILSSPGLMTYALTPGMGFYQFGEYSKIENQIDY
ncbi:MAG: hypothetical protein NXH75_11935, partial [Halobacteriovoraceae bacterium]|nr:hypothetical protein [Halobacteriovoraceae bacterium]